MKKSNLQLGIGVIAWLVLISCFAVAQDEASLTGTIRDNTSAVISGAAVSIRNDATSVVRQTTTNSAGEYVAAALPPGQYDITVTMVGFRTYVAKGVTLRVAQNARIDVTMQIGNAHEEVTVHGECLAEVNTQSSELGGTITG